MDVVSVVLALGGSAPRKVVVRSCGRRAVERALTAGDVVAAGRSLCHPGLQSELVAALRASAVVSHATAAKAWGLSMKHPPGRTWLTVARSRHGQPGLVRADLEDDEVDGWYTAPLRTVLDCARRLPFDEALCIADSAIRRGLVDPQVLRRAAAAASGPGSAACRAVASSADGRAENAFESTLRAIALEISDLSVEPQGEIDLDDFVVHPDLVDRTLRLAIEADSWEHHTAKPAHDRDCERFTMLGVRGWLVLRFSWEQVILRPEYVRQMLRAAVALRADNTHSTGSAPVA